MTQVGSVYGEALYELACGENQQDEILEQLKALNESFRLTPEFIKLLGSHAISKQERCQVLDDSFRGKINQYLLNFLKILTEKGYLRHFNNCCKAFTDCYDEDHGILRVSAVTAVALTDAQQEKLTGKLSRLTGKQVLLQNRIDPAVLGGVRLDYDGQRLDDTLSHRLDSIRDLLIK